MKTFPGYTIDDVIVRGRKVTVVLNADTACGPIIRARATITARTGSTDHVASATIAAEFGARQKLRREHDKVVDRCKSRGTHDH